ncbi:MAG: SpoIIE family protein phosphatase [Firmicutes bacterium]|nr:SpoIIE family protein phosphatase [Bacillota bacterium]
MQSPYAESRTGAHATYDNRVEASAKYKTAMTVLKYAGLLLLQCALSGAPLYGIRPFGTGLYIALLFLDVPFWLISPMYAAAELFSGGVAGILSALVVCAIAGAAVTIRLKFKGKKLPWLLPVASVLTAAGPCAAIAFTQVGAFQIALYAGLAVGFATAANSALKPILKEALHYKMLETEVICLGIVGIAAAMGVAAFDALLFGFPVSMLAASFCVYVTAKTAGIGRAALVGLVFGVGCAAVTLDVMPIACFAFVALVAAGFASAPKIIMPLAGLAGYLMFRFFFFPAEVGDAWIWTVAVGAGGLMYMLVPLKLLARAKNYLFTSSERAAVRYTINRSRAETAAKLSGAAGVFRSMAETLSQSEPPPPDYTGSLHNRCCAICEHQAKCAGVGLEKALDAMLNTVFQKGRANISDIPPYISDRCVNLARLMNVAAAIGEGRRTTLQNAEQEKNSRQVIEAQMRGMTGVLSDLACLTAVPVSYDAEREKALVEELNYAGVAASEAMLCGERITLVLRTESFDRKAVEKTVSRVLRKKYGVTSVDDTVLSGFCCVSMQLKPRYDVVFGAASAAKDADGRSGDTHSFIKIDGRRFMMALCDGMGSGEKAERASETAIGLVESFYRAGFSGDLVLNGVNRFLSSVGGESFSALDICVVDLEAAQADIIKLGSPASYVKRRETVERFEGASAPLGAMPDAVEPSAIRVSLCGGDMLVLATDGVADSFEGDKLSAAVNSLRTLNPQTLSEGILQHTLFNCGGHPRDDSTVLAARIIEVG